MESLTKLLEFRTDYEMDIQALCSCRGTYTMALNVNELFFLYFLIFWFERLRDIIAIILLSVSASSNEEQSSRLDRIWCRLIFGALGKPTPTESDNSF